MNTKQIVHNYLINLIENYSDNSPHNAPTKDDAPLYDLTQLFPEDIYGPNGAKYYGHNRGDHYDQMAIDIINSARNKPNQIIKIYRAVPNIKDKKLTINNGDWVTIIEDYAKKHGKFHLGGKYKILTKDVKASELYSDGDIIEWGYNY